MVAVRVNMTNACERAQLLRWYLVYGEEESVRARTDQHREDHGDRDDRVAAKEGVGDDGSADWGQAQASEGDAGDLRGVDARHVVLLHEVDNEVTRRAAPCHPKPAHRHCAKSDAYIRTHEEHESGNSNYYQHMR